MKQPSTALNTKSGKPYDIRERSMLFACDVIEIVQELQRRGRIASELSLQLMNAAVNAAANLEEADDGSSRRDFRAKDRIALPELKENPGPWNLEPGTSLGFGSWDLGFGICYRVSFPRGDPGVTWNEKRSAGILLPG
jgi:hypothetical protein